MHPRRPTRNSDVEKSNFNPLAVRRYNSVRPTSANTSIIIVNHSDAVESLPVTVVDTLPTEAKVLVRGEEGIPASHYQTAYELAFQNTSRPFSGEGVSWSPLIETLIRGESVRQSMQAPCSLSAVDTNNALLCLRHLWDVQLSLSLTSGRPKKKDELSFIQSVRTELKALQLTLKNREISFAINEKPSLKLALTHLLLGAVSLNLIKLHEKCPEGVRAESTPHTDFSNPIHHAGITARTHTTAPRDQSVLAKLSQAAYDYLEHNGAALSWIRKLQRTDWINEVLQSLGDPSDREDSNSLLELLIRHTETLRKTHQEPIEISLFKVGAYLAAGAGIVLFMKYQVPNPFTAENIKASDGTLGFFAPLQASTTEAASMSPSSSESPSQTLTPTQIETLIQTLNRTLTQTLSQFLSASQSASSSSNGTSSQTLTHSQIETLTQTLSQTLTQTLSQLLSSSQNASPSPSATPSQTLTPSQIQTLTQTLSQTLTQTLSQTLSQLLSPSQSASPSPTPTPPNCNSPGGNFWVETFEGGDYGQSIAISPDGSFALTGMTSSFGAGSADVLIAKFQANGTLVWAQTLGGIAADQGNSIVITPDGSLVLTGYTSSFGAGSNDVLIAKFQANGSLAWAQTLGGTGDDRGNSLAIAPDGGVVLTGGSTSFGAGANDILIAKFQANGTLTWAQTFGGPSYDFGLSLAISFDGSPFLTGYSRSFNGGVGWIGFVAKFQDNGSLDWVKGFTGTGGFQKCYSLAIAPDGSLGLIGVNSDGTLIQIAKLQDNGIFSWAQTFGGTSGYNYAVPGVGGSLFDYSGQKIAITPDGSLVLIGYASNFSSGYTDLLLAKFQADGTFSWAQGLRGVADPIGNSLATSSNGSLILTGYTDGLAGSVLIAQLNSEGNLPFNNTLIEPITSTQLQFVNPIIYIPNSGEALISSLAVNPQVWTTVNVSSINATLQNLNCLSASATQIQPPSPTQTPSQTLSPSSTPPNCNSPGGDFWVETWGGASNDEGQSLAITPDGSLALVGTTYSFGAGGYDVLLAKFQANGSLVWAQTLGGIGTDHGQSLAITPDSSLVLTGYTDSFGAGNQDLILAKYHSNGSLAWVQTLGGTGDDEGYSLAIAPDGSLVLTGVTNSFGAGNNDVFMAKFQANGSLAWAQTLGGANIDWGLSLTISPDGCLLLTGYTQSFGAGSDDVLLAKFQANGSLVWAQIFGGIGIEEAYSLAITQDGSLILMGRTSSFGVGTFDVLLAKFQANGSLIWAQTLGGAGDDAGNSLAIAPDGCLLLIGETSSFGAGGYDVLLAKFQANGSLTWAETLGGAGDDWGLSLAITPNGNLMLTGQTNSYSFGAGYYDVLTAQLNSDGTLPFPNSLIRSITTAQVQFINPTIFNITRNLSIASWGVTPQAWTSVSVSTINNATLENINCATARRRLQLPHQKKARNDEKLSSHLRPKYGYNPLNTLPIVRAIPSSRYDALDKSASSAAAENSFTTLESAMGIGALVCLMTLFMLYFARRIKPAVISQGNANFFARRQRALTVESATTQNAQRHAVNFGGAK